MENLGHSVRIYPAWFLSSEIEHFFALSFGKFNVVSRSITRDNEFFEIIGEERFRGISKLIAIDYSPRIEEEFLHFEIENRIYSESSWLWFINFIDLKIDFFKGTKIVGKYKRIFLHVHPRYIIRRKTSCISTTSIPSSQRSDLHPNIESIDTVQLAATAF